MNSIRTQGDSNGYGKVQARNKHVLFRDANLETTMEGSPISTVDDPLAGWIKLVVRTIIDLFYSRVVS